MQARAAEVQRTAVAYSQGQQYLRRAEEQLKSAAGSLSITQASGFTETIQDVRIGAHGGGLFGRNRHQGNRMDHQNDFAHNAIEMATVHKCQALVKEAGQNIQMAKQAVPNMPFIQPARVQQAMSGVFFNVFAQGLIGDMMQNQKVKKAKADVMEMHGEVVQALDWCTNNMNAAQAESAQINGMLMAMG